MIENKYLSTHFTARQKKLISLIKKMRLSPSHDLDHLANTLKHALRLAKDYNADKKILIPACLLHDLGRTDSSLHDLASIKASVKAAIPLLQKSGYKKKEIKTICRIIAEHDQPQLDSDSLESKILKEADFLDGFGARGIVRNVYWNGESGRAFDDRLSKLQKGMKQRFNSLYFYTSKQTARSQYLFAQLFFHNLNNNQPKQGTYKSKYIVFEGISGTGKETQAKLLKKYFVAKGKKTEIVYHPSQRMKKTIKTWRLDKIDLFTEALMFIADRHDMVDRELIPALRKNKVVFGLRSSVSALVYQARNKWEEHLFEYFFSLFEPKPDLIIYFDLQPNIAYKRISNRFTKTGEEKGRFENIRDLTVKRKKYKKTLASKKNVLSVDASLAIKDLHQIIIKHLSRKKLI